MKVLHVALSMYKYTDLVIWRKQGDDRTGNVEGSQWSLIMYL